MGGVKRLQSLTNLTSLNLAFSKVTDEGIQQLRQLPCLRSLSLRWTSITDSALEYIAAAGMPTAVGDTERPHEETSPKRKSSLDGALDLTALPGSGTTPTALRRSKSDA